MLQPSPAAIGPSKPAEYAERAAISEKRRAYNREYMRAWRANPLHQARERASREKAYCEKKLREALRARQRKPFTNERGVRVCGFCGKAGPVSEVLRLRISNTPRGDYVEVRMPYCGQC